MQTQDQVNQQAKPKKTDGQKAKTLDTFTVNAKGYFPIKLPFEQTNNVDKVDDNMLEDDIQGLKDEVEKMTMMKRKSSRTMKEKQKSIIQL